MNLTTLMQGDNGRHVAVMVALLSFLAIVTGGDALKLQNCKLDIDRLPNRVQPTHYKLNVGIEPWLLRFKARTTIQVKVSDRNGPECDNAKGGLLIACDPTKIILHLGEKLNIQAAKLKLLTGPKDSGTSERVPISNMCRDKARELLVMTLAKPLEPGSLGELMIAVNGDISEEAKGIYNIPDEEDEAFNTIATHFRPTYARNAFPCFDEPHLKATFQLNIEHPRHMQALSNTDLETVESIDDTNVTYSIFTPTPPMSSYLLTFVLGRFDRARTLAGAANKRVSTTTPRGKIRDAIFMSRHAAHAFSALERFFGVELPLSKVDIMALPKMTTSSMENWGLVNIIEPLPYSDIKGGSQTGDMMYSAITLVRSLAHQWWGNLVSMRSWQEMWLSQGVAEWASRTINQMLKPEWDFELSYLLSERKDAFEEDASTSISIASLATYETGEEIDQAIATINYKHISIVRMLSSYLGVDNFTRGLQEFMNAHLLGVGSASDLWTRLEAISGLPLSAFVDSWTSQSGFPLVQVSLSADGHQLKITQKAFTSNVSLTSLDNEQVWHVPVTLEVSDGSINVRLNSSLTERSGELDLPEWFDITKPDHWLKVNVEALGFYRVQYEDDRLWNALGQAVMHNRLGPVDRLNLLEDLDALYRSGRIDSQAVKSALDWLENETEDALLIQISSSLVSLRLRGELDPANLSPTTKTLLDYYERTGKFDLQVADQTPLRKRARPEVISALLRLRNSQVIADASRTFNQVLSGAELTKSIRPTLFYAIAETGSDAQVDQLIKYMRETLTPDERREFAWDLYMSVEDRERAKKIRRGLRH